MNFIKFIETTKSKEEEIELINKAYDLLFKLPKQEKENIDKEFGKYRDDLVSKGEPICPYYQYVLNKITT